MVFLKLVVGGFRTIQALLARTLSHFLALSSAQSYPAISEAPSSIPSIPPMSAARSSRLYTRYSDCTVSTGLPGQRNSRSTIDNLSFWKQFFASTVGHTRPQRAVICFWTLVAPRWCAAGRHGRSAFRSERGTRWCQKTARKSSS